MFTWPFENVENVSNTNYSSNIRIVITDFHSQLFRLKNACLSEKFDADSVAKGKSLLKINPWKSACVSV